MQRCHNEMRPAQSAAGKSSEVTASAVNEKAFHTATAHDETVIHSIRRIPHYNTHTIIMCSHVSGVPLPKCITFFID